MDIKELEAIMIEHGVALRAIPNKIRHVYDKCNIAKFPQAKVVYMEKFKREMLVFETFPENAGKFIFESNQGTGSLVRFSGKEYFDSIEDAAKAILEEKHSKK